MSKEKPKNNSASVRQRLLNLARERNDEFQLMLVRYGIERLLYRLTVSPHGRQFVLKGPCSFSFGPGSRTARPSTWTCSALATMTQWKAFVRRGRLVGDAPEFEQIVDVLHSFLWPVAKAIKVDQAFARRWSPGGPWK